MARRLTLVLAVAVLILLTAGAVWGARYDVVKANSVPRLTGAEFPDYLISGASGLLFQGHCDAEVIYSPYDTVLGCTFYDYQHNSRIPHMVAVDYQSIPPTGAHGVHYTWMEGAAAPPSNRWSTYSYYDTAWSHVPSCHVSMGPSIAGYTGLAVLRPGALRFHSRAVICYHTTAAATGHDTEMYPVLSIETNIPGEGSFCGGSFWYDIPDRLPEPGGGDPKHGMWPACDVDSLNRIHVLVVEQEPAAGDQQDFGYVRCQEIDAGDAGDSIECCTPAEGGSRCWRLEKEKYYSNQNRDIMAIGHGGTISALVKSSKVSHKVACIFTGLSANEPDSSVGQLSNDIYYVESTNGGDDWFANDTVAPVINITEYDSSDMMRAYGEVTGVYDMDGDLHIFFVTHGYDMAAGTYDPTDITLWHWSEATVRICDGDTLPANQVAAAKWEGVEGGAWNFTQTKLTAGIGVVPAVNYNYLYVNWTQFDSLDPTGTFENTSNDGNNQGDLYIAASTDGGKTWNRPFNVTKSSVEDCDPSTNDCASDHWSSIAEVVDSFVYYQYIYDLDAGGIPQDEGKATDNPVLVYNLPLDSVPIVAEARLTYNPSGWDDPPVSIPVGGADTVKLILENPGTKDLSITSITDDADWLTVGSYPATIEAGGCPANVELYIAGTGSEGFLVGTVTVNWTDVTKDEASVIKVHVVESDDYKAPTFVEVENPTYILSISNTGNQGHTEDEAGFFLKGDPNEANFLYDASPIIGWIEPDNDTLVGRYVFDERYMVAATDLSVDTFPLLQTIVAETEFWPIRIQIPPADQDWPFWRLQMKKYMFFSNDSSAAHPFVDNKNEQYLALVSLKAFHDEPPGWWVDVTPPATIPDAYLGLALDIDVISDSGAVNYRGNDTTYRYAYIQGFGGVNENYRMAVGQLDTCWEFGPDSFACWPYELFSPFEDFWAMHVLRNDSVVYPHGGYVDPELYTYMATSGYIMQPGPGEDADYNIIASGGKIPSHSYPSDGVWSVAYVEAVSPKFELATLDTMVRMCRCGNVNRDHEVGVTDITAMINFTLKATGDGIFTFMGDATGDGKCDVVDISYMIGFLLRSTGQYPQCSSM